MRSERQIYLTAFAEHEALHDRLRVGSGHIANVPTAVWRYEVSGWLVKYTTELLNVINVLGLLVETEPAQSALLDRI